MIQSGHGTSRRFRYCRLASTFSYQVEITRCEVVQFGVSNVDDVVSIGEDDGIRAELKAVTVDEILECLCRHIDIGIAEERMVELEDIVVRRCCVEIVDNRQPKIGSELESIGHP